MIKSRESDKSAMPKKERKVNLNFIEEKRKDDINEKEKKKSILSMTY